MSFKPGVEMARVNWFRELVQIAKDLESRVYEGILSPDEAFEKLDETMTSMASKPAPKASKGAKPTS